jgi:esterase/lipase superfamily enzyme
MIKLGPIATGLKWGMEYHEDWSTSLPKLLSEVKHSTPFTDLAIFVTRDKALIGNDHIEALDSAIKARFTNHLAMFWLDKIKKEKLLAKHILAEPFSDTHQAFARTTQIVSTNRFEAVTRDQLLGHILHLEELLYINHIEFSSLSESSSS